MKTSYVDSLIRCNPVFSQVHKQPSFHTSASNTSSFFQFTLLLLNCIVTLFCCTILLSRPNILHNCIKIVCNLQKPRVQFTTAATNRLIKYSILIVLLVNVCMAHPKLSIHSSKMRYYKNRIDYQAYNALIGSPIALPCNITPPSTDDGVSLILWYRDDMSSPIYTVDARSTPHLHSAKHFFDATILSNRATFNITYPVSYLRFNPVVERDTAEYRCRVDFRRGRTINRVMQLNIIVPTKKISIYDSNSNYINDIAGPFNEDSSLNITCDSEGGNPLPTVRWWKGDVLLSDKYTSSSKNIAKNVIKFDRLLREHLMMPLTCEASNTNLTAPVSKTVLIDLNLKPTKVRIIEPLENMTVGQRVELVCQSSGSRPPAKISWRKNEKLLEHYSESTSDDGTVTTNFLTFIPTVEDNSKLLTCTAFNPQFSDFQIQDTLPLNIHYAPILSLLLGASEQRQEIVQGSDVYFDCNIQSNPQVQTFGWLFNGNKLTEKDNSIKIRNNSVIINGVDKVHNGAYQCYAANPLGKSVSEIVNLNVKFVPICASKSKTFYQSQPFQELNIECKVDANPEDVLFYWEFNSTNTDSQADKSNLHNEQPQMRIKNSGLSSVLKFMPRSLQDYGTIYCYAKNRIGQQSTPCIFHINKSEIPTAPQNCSITNITAASLTVQCSTEDDSIELEQQHILEIYKDNSQLVKNITSTEGALFRVFDLPPGFHFNLFVYSINQNGQSEKVRINANTPVGEPRKLEHIEQKINVKPFVVLLVLFLCLLTLTLFLLFILVKLRNRHKAKRQSKESCCTVFDTGTMRTENVADVTATKSNLDAYSLQIRSCHQNKLDALLPAVDSVEMITLNEFTPENCNASKNVTLRNCLTSTLKSELTPMPMPSQSYLELTDLEQMIENQMIEQNRHADDYSGLAALMQSQTNDHVAICSNLTTVTQEDILQYLHPISENGQQINNSFFTPCPVLESGEIRNEIESSNSLSEIPCIIVGDESETGIFTRYQAAASASDSSTNSIMKIDKANLISFQAPNNDPVQFNGTLPLKSAPKVRFCE